jgi:hypothetical protein
MTAAALATGDILPAQLELCCRLSVSDGVCLYRALHPWTSGRRCSAERPLSYGGDEKPLPALTVRIVS